MGPQTYRVLHHERKRRTLVVAVEDLPGLGWFRMKRYPARETTEQPAERDRPFRAGTNEQEEHHELDEKIDTAHAGTGQKSESAVDARSRSKLFARVLEDWHDRLNSKAANGHNGLYELLQILIAEQDHNDSCTLEQFLEALIYTTPETVQFTFCNTNFEDKHQLTNLQQFANRDTDYTNLEVNTFDITTSCKNIETLLNAAQGKKRSRCRKYMEKNAAVHRLTWKLLELEISAHWRVTKSGRQFFMYNNVQNSVMKMYESWLNILSGTFKNIEGTFKIVPEWYQQMFTIHSDLKEDELIPLIYCLTVRKDLPTYHEIFDNLMLKAAASGVVRRPHTVICDFETALIPAVQASFPASAESGRTWLANQVPLRSRNKEEDSNGDGNSIFATSEVPAAVDLLGRNVTGPIAALFDYFQREWINPNRLLL
ncbi:hypothetical protein T4A_7867 [Trichinella pseudospiralis]|uniref:MULE transposase domain-containing protein n=1 Tax=Trichinella pseudospiralis TaxID=6337 RepID=A0A0V1ES99_TRIPS|nr:hypothetical protein T4A_7867 [Trichinella pseudospiralis]